MRDEDPPFPERPGERPGERPTERSTERSTEERSVDRSVQTVSLEEPYAVGTPFASTSLHRVTATPKTGAAACGGGLAAQEAPPEYADALSA